MKESATACAQQKQQAKKQKKKAAQQVQQPTEAAMREAANSARDKRAAKRNEQKSESSAEPEENTEETHASAAEPEAEAATPISEATAEQPKKRKRGRPKKTETESWAKWKSTYKQKAQPMYALNTEVRDSKQKGAGKGLFMLEKAKAGDRVAVYAGEQITEEEAKARDSQYILRVREGVYLDAEKEMRRKGRFINHAGPGTVSNARISKAGRVSIDPKTKGPCVSIIARKVIMPGEEILIAYHDHSAWDWPWNKKADAAPQMMTTEARASTNSLSASRARGRGRGRGCRGGRGGRGRGARQANARRRSRCEFTKNSLLSIIEAARARALSYNARRSLESLWNSSIQYAQHGNKNKLSEKLGEIYKMLRPKENQKIGKKQQKTTVHL